MRGRATQLVRRPALERGKTLTIFISRSSRVPSRPLIMADSPRERSSRSVSPVARSRSRPMSRSRSPSRSRVREWSRSLSRSPDRGMSRSPVRGMSRSPVRGMSGSPVRGMSRSPVRGMSGSPVRGVSRSRSPIRGVSRSRSPVRVRDAAANPGNTLYVTGLSTRVTERDLESHFAQEGKVVNCRLVVEPRSRISRGFAFVTMGSLEDADRCVKYLNQSVLEGRYITVEKSRRKRPRTPTPGHYLGLKNSRESGFRSERGGGRYRSGYGRDDYGSRRSPRRSPYRGSRDYSPRRSPPYRGSHDYSPRRSPPYRGSRDYSPRRSPYGGGRSRRERSLSRSPYDSPGRGYGRRPAYAR